MEVSPKLLLHGIRASEEAVGEGAGEADVSRTRDGARKVKKKRRKRKRKEKEKEESGEVVILGHWNARGLRTKAPVEAEAG